MTFLINGEEVEKEFEDVQWDTMSPADYDVNRKRLNFIQQGKADKARKVKPRGFAMGPVSAPVKPKAAADPYDAIFHSDQNLFTEATDKYSLKGWANYFYCECSAQDKKEFFKRVYTPERRLQPSFTMMDNDAARSLLADMLLSGFTAYPDTYKGNDQTLFPQLGGNAQLRVGFRGELRQPAQVKAQNGCLPKARIVTLQQSLNMSKPWHPFSLPAYRDKVYYRKGNGDNCLFTVVSVTTDFDTACKFPLLADLNDPKDIGIATVEAQGLQSRVAALQQQIGDAITRQRNSGIAALPPAQPTRAVRESRVRILKSVRMNVYLFRVPEAWNTEKYQADHQNESFHERAADKVPWANFLARVRIDRIHYGGDSNDGHLNVIDGFDMLHSRADISNFLGGGQAGAGAYASLVAYLDALCAQGKLNPDGTGGKDFRTPNSNPDVRVTKVIRIDPKTDWGVVRF
jgi:hypothetical protein